MDRSQHATRHAGTGWVRRAVWLTSLVMAMLLAGCASTGGSTGDSPRMLEADSADADIDWPDDQWWQQFGDSGLDELVARAMRDNPDLHGARSRAQKAAAEVEMARSGRMPHIEGSAGVERRRFPEHDTTGESDAGKWRWDNSASLGLSWDLDLWGRHYQQEQAAIGEARAAEVGTREARLALQTAVVRAYVGLSRALQMQSIAKRDLERRQALLDFARQRYQSGMGTRLELSQFKTKVPEAREEVERLQASVEVLRHQLAALVGSPDPLSTADTDPTIALEAEVSLPEELPANLLGHRPDIVAARWHVEAAGHDVESARAAFYPDVNLNGMAGVASLGFGHFLGSSTTEFGAGPAVTLPIFEGGRLRGGLRHANADYDLAVDMYNSQVVEAMQQTADVISELKALGKRTQESEKSLASARETYDMATQGFKSGLTNQLNVLEAESALLDAERKQADLKAQRLDQYAVLMQTLGGGFERQESHSADPRQS